MNNDFKKQFQDEDFILYRLTRVAREVSRLCTHEYDVAFGMKVPDWRVLAMIGRFGNISAKTLSDKMAIDQVAVSRSVHRCVTSGLVREDINPQDRRGKVLMLTPSGEKILDRFYPHACALALRIESGLTKAEVKTLKSLLYKLDIHLQSVPRATPEKQGTRRSR